MSRRWKGRKLDKLLPIKKEYSGPDVSEVSSSLLSDNDFYLGLYIGVYVRDRERDGESVFIIETK